MLLLRPLDASFLTWRHKLHGYTVHQTMLKPFITN